MRALLFLSLVLFPVAANAEDDPPQDPAAVEVLNNLMQALLVEDMEQSVKESVKYLHKSLLNKGGDDVSADLRRFSFKKARDNAKLYGAPVKVARVRPTGATGVGFKETAEKGKVQDYLIEKKDGKGLPAPVKIFFPDGGGKPKVAYLGGL